MEQSGFAERVVRQWMSYADAMTTVSVSELRKHLKSVLERVKEGETVQLTQNGEVVAAVLHAVLYPDAPQWRVETPNTVAAERLLETFDLPTGPLPEPSLTWAEGEALVAEMRAAREAGR
ncbi:hypothetical protein BH24DEI2_BH24DEI2_07670 [soil metagenome]